MLFLLLCKGWLRGMEEGRQANSTELGSSCPIGSQSGGQDKKSFIKQCSKADWKVWESRVGREREPSRVQSLATVLQKATAFRSHRTVAMVGLELLLSEAKVFGLP